MPTGYRRAYNKRPEELSKDDLLLYLGDALSKLKEEVSMLRAWQQDAEERGRFHLSQEMKGRAYELETFIQRVEARGRE